MLLDGFFGLGPIKKGWLCGLTTTATKLQSHHIITSQLKWIRLVLYSLRQKELTWLELSVWKKRKKKKCRTKIPVKFACSVYQLYKLSNLIVLTSWKKNGQREKNKNKMRNVYRKECNWCSAVLKGRKKETHIFSQSLQFNQTQDVKPNLRCNMYMCTCSCV